MNTEPAHDTALPRFYAPALLPPAQPAGTVRWLARIVAWLAVAALYVLTIKHDVDLMHWRYDVMPEGPHGTLRQVLYGFRDFGQILPIIVTIVIVLRMDRRRWTIVSAILIAQIFAGAAYNTGKLTIARYRPQPAIKQALAASTDSVPDKEKDAYALSKMKVQQTWIGWRPGNGDEATQSFPSGHSAAAFAFAGVLVWFYPKLTVTFWFLAAGCAVSRYLDAVHWLSDCAAGASIGYVAAWLSLHPHVWSTPLRLLRAMLTKQNVEPRALARADIRAD